MLQLQKHSGVSNMGAMGFTSGENWVQYGNFDYITMALMPYVNINLTEKKTNQFKFQVLIRLARLFFISANLSTTGLTSSKSAELSKQAK